MLFKVVTFRLKKQETSDVSFLSFTI